MVEITLEDIKSFSKEYNDNPTNKIIENAIANNGLENTMLNRDVIIENQPVFNIELPESKRYDQKDSYKCWIYAGLDMIKFNIAKNLNIDVKQLQLSANYISLFDRLEKANHTYNNIIEMKNASIKKVIETEITKLCVSEGGYFEWFEAIVNKYGLIPEQYMPDAKESINYAKISDLYDKKIKKDITELILLKQTNASKDEMLNKQKTYNQENYEILSKILGEPKLTFNLEYKDKDEKMCIFKNITPLDFKNKFLTLRLENFVSIGNVPMYNKEYNKVYSRKYLGNLKCTKFLNLPIEDLKTMVIKQLKDKIPVYMGAHIINYRDKKSGILDKRLYNYSQTFHIKDLTKEEALNFEEITMHHAMAFSGVHIIDDKPIRWKIEDSYGDKEKYNGYYIMNDNFFDEYVLGIVVDKKYLSEEQKALLEQEPIEYQDESY